jgi:hypothetical protein
MRLGEYENCLAHHYFVRLHKSISVDMLDYPISL